MNELTAENLIKLTNEYRKQQGLQPLKVNDALMKAAQERANNMASTGNFSHRVATTTNMTTPYAFMQKNGYQFADAGENLAEGYKTADGTMLGWQKSKSHNENLLNPRYSEMGLAVVPVVYNGKKSNFVIQFFGNPPAQKPQVSPATTSIPKPVTGPSVAPSALPPIAPPAVRAFQVARPAGRTVPAPLPAIPKPMPLFISNQTFKNSNSTIPMASRGDTSKLIIKK